MFVFSVGIFINICRLWVSLSPPVCLLLSLSPQRKHLHLHVHPRIWTKFCFSLSISAAGFSSLSLSADDRDDKREKESVSVVGFVIIVTITHVLFLLIYPSFFIFKYSPHIFTGHIILTFIFFYLLYYSSKLILSINLTWKYKCIVQKNYYFFYSFYFYTISL